MESWKAKVTISFTQNKSRPIEGDPFKCEVRRSVHTRQVETPVAVIKNF